MAYRLIIKTSPDVSLPVAPGPTHSGPAVWSTSPTQNVPPLTPRYRPEFVPLCDVPYRIKPHPSYNVATWDQERLAVPPVIPKLRPEDIPPPDLWINYKKHPSYNPATWETRQDPNPPITPKQRRELSPMSEFPFPMGPHPSLNLATWESRPDPLPPPFTRQRPERSPMSEYPFRVSKQPWFNVSVWETQPDPKPLSFQKQRGERTPMAEYPFLIEPHSALNIATWETRPDAMPPTFSKAKPERIPASDISAIITAAPSPFDLSWCKGLSILSIKQWVIAGGSFSNANAAGFTAPTSDYGWTASYSVPNLPKFQRRPEPDPYAQPPNPPGNTPDYGWTPLPPLPLVKPFKYHEDLRGTASFAIAVTADQWLSDHQPRPVTPVRRIHNVAPHVHVPIILSPTYDYGWTSAAIPPKNIRNLFRPGSDLSVPAAIATTPDYGWTSAAVPSKTNRNILRTPGDLFIPIVGSLIDYGSVRPLSRTTPRGKPAIEMEFMRPAPTPDYGWTSYARQTLMTPRPRAPYGMPPTPYFPRLSLPDLIETVTSAVDLPKTVSARDLPRSTRKH